MSADNDEHQDTDPRQLVTPVDFENWPADEQLDHIAAQFNRRGLLTQVLLLSGRDVAGRDIDGDTQLTKRDLAAIYYTLHEVFDDA